MKTILTLCMVLIISIFSFAQKRAMTVDDLWNMKRVGKIVLSSDGKTIAFALTTYSMDANKGNSDIYLIDTDGNNLRELKASAANESNPQFLPGQEKISFNRNGQIWMCSLVGTNEEQITDFSPGVSGLKWSNSNNKFLFVSSVYPDCTEEKCNQEKDSQKENSKVQAKIITGLMYRYWDSWRDEKRSHLFMRDVEKDKYYDLILNSNSDVPPVDLGSDNDYSFSPEGKEIAFTMNVDDTVAISTNNDVFIIKTDEIKEGKQTPYTKISLSKGNDNHPLYSPDGKYIAYRSMERAGFEADRLRIMLYDRTTGKTKELTSGFDRTITEFTWSPDSKYIYFIAENEIYNSIYKLEVASSKIDLILKENKSSYLQVSPDGKTIYFRMQNNNLPDEIFSINTDGSNLKQITFTNKDILAQLEMNPIETTWFEGAEGAKVQAIIVKPPFFDELKKYPMLLLVHGGPQGKWEDDFHYRWNLQMFAAAGYVVVAPNPRGSTGYGQKFTDEISGDWGGKPYIDVMNCYDYVLSRFDYIDRNNTFAAGASYGGYMMNWIEGHNDRFNAIVCHDGVFNLESMYGTTEELWFPQWEFKGTPWSNRELYRKFSPHQYVDYFKTPMLVVQGGQDFRVSEEQGFQLFTSLQRKGVDSKFLYFPDENHFVLKPQNAKLWWTTIFDWFKTHAK